MWNITSPSMMDVTDDTVEPMRPQLVIHWFPAIDTLNKNNGIWIPTTSAIGSTPNITHGSASRHDVGKGTVVG